MYKKAWLIFVGLTFFHIVGKAKSIEKFQVPFENGDWKATVEFLEDYCVNHGVSVSQNLEWHPVSTLNLYNFYNESSFYPAIVVSNYPTKDSIWLYWNNWSETLTGGMWSPKEFFKNKKEAKLLAHYNVLMLLSHEMGHHIAQRYSIRNKHLNCFENLADLASMSLVKDLEKQSYFKTLQDRYMDLLHSINEGVSADYRFTNEVNYTTGFCEEMDVKYPADTVSMIQYASAYFVRRQHLHNQFINMDAKQILESVFMQEQVKWFEKSPVVNSNMSIVKQMSNMFEYPVQIDQDMSINRFLFQPQVDALSGYTLSSSQTGYHWKTLVPKDQCEKTVITFDASFVNGKPYNQWYFKCSKEQMIRSTKILSFVIDESTTKPTILLEEIDSSRTKVYSILSSDTGFYLKKTYLNLRESSVVRIIGVEGEVVKLLQQIELSDSTSKVTEVRYSLLDNRGIMDRVIAIVPLSATKNGIVHATVLGNTYYMSVGYYIIQVKDGIVGTIAGSGLFGNRLELKEVRLPKAIFANEGEVLVLDAQGYSSNEENMLAIKRIVLQ